MTAISSNPAAELAGSGFEDAAVAVMGELQGAMDGLVGALAGTVHRAVDVERALRLDKKLAWQVFRLARSGGLAEVANVPSRSSVRRLIAAARARRVSPAVVGRVAEAFDRFEEFAVAHGGDRAGLMSMVSGLPHAASEEFDLKVRKSLFRASAHVYGMQAEMRARTLIHMPRVGADGGRVADLLMVQSEIGLQRLREGQALAISVSLKTSRDPFTEANSRPTGTWKPQADSTHPSTPGPDILAEFSSRPLPEMRPRASAIGGVETELIFPAIGRAGAVTLCSNIYMEDTGEGEGGVYFGKTLVRMPTEAMVIDMLIPTGVTDPGTARASVYARREHPENVFEMRKEDLLPQRETLGYMGAMDSIPAIAGAARHADAVRHMLGKAGWAGTSFDVYRLRVEYPVMHSMLFYAVDAVRGEGEGGGRGK